MGKTTKLPGCDAVTIDGNTLTKCREEPMKLVIYLADGKTCTFRNSYADIFFKGYENL